MEPPPITVSDLEDAKTFLTTTDEYILLRIRTRNPEQPVMWLRMGREDFINFAGHLSKDAKQLKAKH